MKKSEVNQSECWITADWPVPDHVHAGCSTRIGGISKPPYDELNLGMHVGDHKTDVLKNRELLIQTIALPAEPAWLQQLHGNRVISLDRETHEPMADGAYASQPGLICTVLTADCVPVLLCSDDGREIAAVHAGWRGFSKDIIGGAVQRFSTTCKHISAWIGPCIDGQHYETDENVKESCLAIPGTGENAFLPSRPGHYLTDLKALVRQRLQEMGVGRIYGGQFCTYTHSRLFFSCRREGTTGRFASLIWMDST
jgi:YfiH family protein